MTKEKKIHVLTDESLGGVKREYVEVERKAEVGDYVFVHGEGIEKVVGLVDLYIKGVECADFWVGDGEYTTIEPTDIVHIDDERFRLVDRKAEVGECVLVKMGAQSTDECNHGKSFEVTEIDGPMLVYTDGTHEDGSPLNLVNGDYFVLVPVESEKEATSPQSIEDLIANLATRMSAIERRVTALEDKHEAQSKQLADIGRSTWYLEDDVTYAKEARYQLALEIRDIKARLEATANALRKGD